MHHRPNSVKAAPVAVVLSLLLAPATAVGQAGTIWYVDDDGDPGGGCTSWSDACPDLQTALGLASPGDEIWVAAGTYAPDGGTGDRTASFQLIAGVAIRGGFDGLETTIEQLAGLFDQTILTGDLNGDDAPEDFPGGPSYADNSHHVVSASGVDATAVLDGFTITAGNADGTTPHETGGGMLLSAASPTVRRCRLVGNSALIGGGAYDVNGGVAMVDCLFARNAASHFGGGYDGMSASALLVNCVFVGNTAFDGGAVHTDFGTSTLINCTITGNAATNHGGGVYLYTGVTAVITNCVLWANGDGDGGGEPAQLFVTAGGNTAIVDYTCLEGWTGQIGGIGNTGDDPLFADPGAEDFRLRPESPCVDAGSNGAVPEDVTTDVDGNPRVVDGDGDGSVLVDLGAYERQPCPADVDGNGEVDVDDLVQVILQWSCTDPPGPCSADVTRNGVVDVDDLVEVILAWGACAGPPSGPAS